MTGLDAGDVLQSLVERVVGAFDLPAAALVLGDTNGSPHLAVSTSERIRRLVRMELDRGEGPGAECRRTGRGVAVDARRPEASRWAWFAAEAAVAGFGWVHVLPVRHRDVALGALTMCGTGGALGPRELAGAQAMADLAAMGLVHQRAAAEARALSEQLQQALDSRVVIEQAKGLVAGRTGVDVGAAFRLLRAHARTNNVALAEVARRVLDGRIPVEALGVRHPGQ